MEPQHQYYNAYILCTNLSKLHKPLKDYTNEGQSEGTIPSHRNDWTLFNTASVKSWLLERSTKQGRWRTIKYSSSPAAGFSHCKHYSPVQCPNVRLLSPNSSAILIVKRTKRTRNKLKVEQTFSEAGWSDYWPWIERREIRPHIEAEPLASLQAKQTSHFSCPCLAQQLHKENCAQNRRRDSSPAKIITKNLVMIGFVKWQFQSAKNVMFQC